MLFNEQTFKSKMKIVSLCPCQDYGGFLTLMMLKSTERLIRCAAAQTPIVDWSMYGKFKIKARRLH